MAMIASSFGRVAAVSCSGGRTTEGDRRQRCSMTSFHWKKATESSRQRLIVRALRTENSKKVRGELDRWMRHSVVEIVNKIGEAPLVVRVYSSEGNSNENGGSVRLETEKADAEDWASIARRLEFDGSARGPDAVILVKELEGGGNPLPHSDATKLWGMVVQGREPGGSAGGYLLKTTRIAAPFGFCTHYCLVSADCAPGSTEDQLKNLWLQGRPGPN